MKLGIIIPALNEEEKIAKTVQNIPRKIKGIKNIEVLVVDDGSKDKTRSEAIKSGAKVISHDTNKGVGEAFQTGLEWALSSKKDILVNIDADGQFNPDDIPGLIEPILQNNADVVIANRFQKGRPENMSATKYHGNKMMTFLINKLSGLNLTDVSSGFRAYNREAMLRLNLLGGFTYTQESILDLSTKGLRVRNHDVKVIYFKSRKSRVASSIPSYALKTSAIIFKSFRDYSPLKFFGFTGLSLLIIGFLLDIFVLWHYLNNGSFTPYVSVILIGIYLNTLGLGIVILGVIADMFDRVRKNQENILYLLKKQRYERE